MDFQQSRFQAEIDGSYFNEPQADVRRDPNYALLLFLIILLTFGAVLAAICISNGKLPFVD